MIVDTINRCLNFFGIIAESQTIGFGEFKSIPYKDKGIYIIHSTTQTIYVGKGLIRSRQPHHWCKATGVISGNTKDTEGWQWLRENYLLDPNTWNLTYIRLNTLSEQSAMEGALIHFLKPMANDEIFGQTGMLDMSMGTECP